MRQIPENWAIFEYSYPILCGVFTVLFSCFC
jgi:hypothetical protein